MDADLQWMVDFPTAVQAGMALKIPLTADLSAKGIDQIFVYGLRGNDTQAGQTFAALLNAHHYTDGLALVPQGSPTNNTPDATSAYSRKDPNYEISFETEREGPLTSNPACDGVDARDAGRNPHNDFRSRGRCRRHGFARQHGYAAFPVAGDAGIFPEPDDGQCFFRRRDRASRQYVLANAYPRGPIPAFRVGQTPYGVLPVTSLRSYAVDPKLAGPVETGLVNFVQKLWPTWLASSGGAPQMQRGGDPDQNLM